ncbi:anaerobic ribonucleoside-triphosphate reductase activating protein [bacterium]|nr:anaerobic ribonucleoside-triphosphate reductase activating protein [bacterium]MBT5988559.1 anaerobic ribonucleoside-triphosphate reductase activating protein [bacterium]MBT7088484.1 anaerobic ribonucleoside-triphosphate reductase activating protein [bacterium]
MKIKYIQKTSLIDYPGYLAAVVFVTGCDFRCGYCYNKTLQNFAKADDFISVAEILQTIKERSKFIEGVVVTGGEPCVQPGLVDFLAQIKDLGLKIKLDTNGHNAELLEFLVNEKKVDYVAMDIKAAPQHYETVVGSKVDLEQIKQSVACLLKTKNVLSEFRTTVWQGFATTLDFHQIFELIKGAENYYIQNFYSPEAECTGSYLPMSRSEIEPILEMGRKYVGKIVLRGDWL